MATIEVACDMKEADEFAEWLRGQGHEARVSDSTGSTIDGVGTHADERVAREWEALWLAYCQSDIE